MINRGEIIWLGVASGVTGGMIGGMMLGIGIAMMLDGVYVGLLLICIGAPVLRADRLAAGAAVGQAAGLGRPVRSAATRTRSRCTT